jgi:hypothetical protein
MGAIVKLDRQMVVGRMGWQPAGLGADEEPKPRFTSTYYGLLAQGDYSEIDSAKLEMTFNSRLTVPLDCTLAPPGTYATYHVLIAPNPKLLEVAEVSAPSLVIPGTERFRPVMHIRAVKKLNLEDFDWLATIHLVD